MAHRTQIPFAVQVEVFFRDGWLCSHCRRPTIFHLALRHLAEVVGAERPDGVAAYWHPNWRRDRAPLLDELAASVDHVEAFSKGGEHGIANFATICARCNGRKSARSREEYLEANKPWVVRGAHGEPTAWDGLSSVFVFFARRASRPLTATEKSWLTALEDRDRSPAR